MLPHQQALTWDLAALPSVWIVEQTATYKFMAQDTSVNTNYTFVNC